MIFLFCKKKKKEAHLIKRFDFKVLNLGIIFLFFEPKIVDPPLINEYLVTSIIDMLDQ